jgi:putative FmdB family regulatory protein
MPTYEYACKSCGQHLEVVQSFKDDPLKTCAVCGGPLRKVFGSIGIAFKGSGFYRNDSRTAASSSGKTAAASSDTASSEKAEKAGSAASSDGGSSSGSSSDTGTSKGDSKGNSKGDSKPATSSAS